MLWKARFDSGLYLRTESSELLLGSFGRPVATGFSFSIGCHRPWEAGEIRTQRKFAEVGFIEKSLLGLSLGGTAWLVQQWKSGTRFTLLGKPAVAPDGF
jgi:hypothetical protein